MASRSPVQASQERVRLSPYPERRRSPVKTEVYRPVTSNIYRLVVQPIVKGTVGERDTSGNELDPFVAGGASFQEILEKLWEQFSPHVKGRTVKVDGAWALEPATIFGWTKFMTFKVKKHIIDSEKSEQDWKIWVQSMQDKTVKLLIYDYGVGLGRKQDRQAFLKDCIRPTDTDRAGAAAEVTLRETVCRLQDFWGPTYDGEAVVWRMWANEVTRSVDRTTWDDAIRAPPPPRILRLLRASDSQMQEHIGDRNRSTRMVVDCVNATIAEVRKLRHDWESFGRRFETFEEFLQGRKSQAESFLHHIDLPNPSEIRDPMENMENIEDVEHQ
ncbi:hypothetical protein PHPALM_30780 [Phytophthora palmivora]|uniref:Uncharacterized protein n=1 Tax=Phytophthora palmivora TaxID=4796 RepID=A0A2P4X4A0_9STRA|nr:hypothetical protein PHPALM_30780 [Phytophthora palmivora]